MEKVKIKGDYIELGQFLKLINLVMTGGEAKIYIMQNRVLVNGETESRRGRKLRNNDVVKVDNKEYLIIDDNQ